MTADTRRSLRLDCPYLGPLIARTDLHGGGILFATVYRELITFHGDSTVNRRNEIVLSVAQFHREAQLIENVHSEGRYHWNDREHLVCEFTDQRFNGVLCGANREMLVFDIFRPSTRISSSCVYTLATATSTGC
ncbi:MAG: hypothetical protein R3E77_13860 [Steroidobacteraceae bacterium]